MNAPCAVSSDEIKHDLKGSLDAVQWSILRSDLRMEIINVAERIIRGEKASVYRYGIIYTKEQAFIDFVEHHLSDGTIFDAWNGDRMPLTDLLTRIVQRVVAVAWYGEADADELGFLK